MALSTSTIKTKLASVSRNLKDNEAQNIINAATPADLKGLNVESVLRLYEALAMFVPRVYSKLDDDAMKKLRTNTQYQPVKFTPDYGVNLITKSAIGKPIIQSHLTSLLINRLYNAEKKRLSWYEKIGIDGSTIGRGQLGQAAYTDVKNSSSYKGALEKCLATVFISDLLKKAVNSFSPASFSQHFNTTTYKIKIPQNYSDVWRTQAFEDVVVAAYVAIKIERATKPGRSPKDTLRFAIAVYHGMFSMVSKAQKTVKNTINWLPVEAELLKQGYSDEVAYVKEIVI